MDETYFFGRENYTNIINIIANTRIYKTSSISNNQLTLEQIIKANIRDFYKKEHTKYTVFNEFNNAFINKILEYISNRFSQQKQQQQQQQQPITNQQIQQQRKIKIEKDFNNVQENFKNTMNPPEFKPNVPNFQDNVLDEKIVDMETELKKIMDQRNYDIPLEPVTNNSTTATKNVVWKDQQKEQQPLEESFYQTSTSTSKLDNIERRINNIEKDIKTILDILTSNKNTEESESYDV